MMLEISHPKLIGDFRHWLEFVGYSFRVNWRKAKWRPFHAIRRAIYTVNHGVMASGERYRQCHRMKWIEHA